MRFFKAASFSLNFFPVLASGIVAWSVLGLSLILQHWFHFRPCAWCVIQRIAFFVFGALSLGAAISFRKKSVQLVFFVAMFLTAFVGFCAALYQFLVAQNLDSCSMGIANRVISYFNLDTLCPYVLEPTALCSESYSVAGMPIALWSAGVFSCLVFSAGTIFLKKIKNK